MKFSRLAFLLVCAVTLFASDSPDTREITDPKTIASLPALGAAPIPVDDLFFTRSISGGAWSPDGKEVVFSTNLTGRNNLWKVSAAGGWPIQLASPTIANPAQLGRLTANGSFLNRITAALKFTTFSRFLAMAARL